MSLFRSFLSLKCSFVGVFCSFVGVFCSVVGLVCSELGLICAVVGLFCSDVGLSSYRFVSFVIDTAPTLKKLSTMFWQFRPTHRCLPMAYAAPYGIRSPLNGRAALIVLFVFIGENICVYLHIHTFKRVPYNSACLSVRSP